MCDYCDYRHPFEPQSMKSRMLSGFTRSKFPSLNILAPIFLFGKVNWFQFLFTIHKELPFLFTFSIGSSCPPSIENSLFFAGFSASNFVRFTFLWTLTSWFIVLMDNHELVLALDFSPLLSFSGSIMVMLVEVGGELSDFSSSSYDISLNRFST